MTPSDSDRTAESVAPNTGPESTRMPAILLSGQQQALLRALDKRSSRLASIYRGGLAVLGDTSNPDRFAQSAHSLRELMEKLPEFLDVPTGAQKERLKAKARELENLYVRTRENTICFSVSNGWDGGIDRHLRKLLLHLGGCVDWFTSENRRRSR